MSEEVNSERVLGGGLAKNSKLTREGQEQTVEEALRNPTASDWNRFGKTRIVQNRLECCVRTIGDCLISLETLKSGATTQANTIETSGKCEEVPLLNTTTLLVPMMKVACRPASRIIPWDSALFAQ